MSGTGDPGFVPGFSNTEHGGTSPRTRIFIERVRLTDFELSHRDAERLGAALEAALGDLVARQGLGAESPRKPVMRAEPAIRMTQPLDPLALAEVVAERLHSLAVKHAQRFLRAERAGREPGEAE